MYSYLSVSLMALSLMACAPELEDSFGEACATCDTLNSNKLVAQAPWLSCWVEPYQPESDLDPSAGIFCHVDSDIAFSGDERLIGVNAMSARAYLGDALKEFAWRPGNDREFLVTTMNPTFDRDFPVELEMQVKTYGGGTFTQSFTINEAQEATAENPLQLIRPYDLWRVEVSSAEDLRVTHTNMTGYSIPLTGLSYSEAYSNTQEDTYAVQVESLPKNNWVYLPVVPGFQGSLGGVIKTSFTLPEGGRQYREFEYSIPSPGSYLIERESLVGAQ